MAPPVVLIHDSLALLRERTPAREITCASAAYSPMILRTTSVMEMTPAG
jgi:hypothetical protein